MLEQPPINVTPLRNYRWIKGFVACLVLFFVFFVAWYPPLVEDQHPPHVEDQHPPQVEDQQPHVEDQQPVKKPSDPRFNSRQSWRKLGCSRLDWLHFPKTGTSFLKALGRYQCDLEIANGILTEEEVYYDVIRGTEAFEASDTNGSTLALKECEKGLHYLHTPIQMSDKYGHFACPLENVVSMFRDPKKRLASGFVHDFKTCEHMQHDGFSSLEVCDVLLKKRRTNAESAGDSNDTPRQLEGDMVELGDVSTGEQVDVGSRQRLTLHQARGMVERYARCIVGCQTNMMTGKRCGEVKHEETSTPEYDRLNHAIAKLERLAFVGITERWSDSMCLWMENFKLYDGNQFDPCKIGMNVRPSKDASCEQAIHEHLDKIKWHDAFDEALFANVTVLFDKRLQASPTCSANVNRDVACSHDTLGQNNLNIHHPTLHLT
jgi:hypothetical protein